MSEPLVIVGNGMAATRLVRELTQRALGRFAIAVLGAEPCLSYNRVLLSSVLAGEVTSNEIELQPPSWWAQRGVTLSYGRPARAIDLNARRVDVDGSAPLAYGKLVFATGSEPLRLKIDGADLQGVHTFRDVNDVVQLLALGAAKKRVVVIGGGLLGLEAAYGMKRAGAHVVLVHVMDRLMERQLDRSGAELLTKLVEAKGIRVLLNANTSRITGDEHVTGIELADGRTIAADAVVFAAGIRPRTALAAESGLTVNRGIVVRDDMRTSADDVYALGECAEHRGVCYGLVEPAYEQASALAQTLIGRTASYAGSLMATNLKVSGVSVFSAGDYDGAPGSEALTFRDHAAGVYRKLVIADGVLTGAVLVGDTSDALWYLDLIRARQPIAAMRQSLMFGRDLAQPQAA